MEIGWYLRRLRRMSIAEIAWRTRTALVQQAWRFGTPRVPAVGSIAWNGAKLPPLEPIDPTAKQHLLTCAEGILAGRWPVFGRNFDTAPTDPDWHLDIHTGIRSDPTLYCFAVPYRDPLQVGTVKYVWDPSRLHHVTLLAAAYHLSGDTRFAHHAAEHLKSWWRGNPPLRGIHWLSGIEIGMRLIAFVWTRRLLGAWPGVAALFERNPDFLLQLHHHERWLAALYSRGSSANNHLIAEAAGLFIATTAFSGTPQQARWAALAAGILEQEALTQTFPDGLNRELAFGYHGYVLGLLLLAAVEGEAGHPLSDDCWQALTRMADALAANLTRDPAGTLQAPRQGDGDDAVALLVDAPESGPWSPVLELAAAVLGARDWWPKPAQGSVLAKTVAPIARTRRDHQLRPAERPNAFKDAGITFLRTEDDAISVRVDHGPHGYLATAAHGHADALSFELAIGGQPVLIDPGTYCYQGQPEWRRYFRSTLAHNTLEIGGADQAVQAGPFLWSTRPAGWVESMRGIADGDEAELTVAHDGYQRLDSKVTHFRRFVLDRHRQRLAVTDWVEAVARTPVRLAFHFHPAVAVTLDGHRARLSWTGGAAVIDLPEKLSWAFHRGAEQPPLGWFSRAFGEKMPTTVLVGSGEMSPGERFETRLENGAEAAAAGGRGLKEIPA